MGWTRKEYKRLQRRLLYAVILIILIANMPLWTGFTWTQPKIYAFMPLIVLMFFYAKWNERRFIGSADPTPEQEEAWAEYKVLSSRSMKILAPIALVFFILLALGFTAYGLIFVNVAIIATSLTERPRSKNVITLFKATLDDEVFDEIDNMKTTDPTDPATPA